MEDNGKQGRTKQANKAPGRTDGRFHETACGSIVDTQTKLEWAVGPDATLPWKEAVTWATALATCGGGWSMPSSAQLATLFDKNQTAGTGFAVGGKHWPAHLDPVFSGIGSGSWVWSKDERNATSAKAYNYNQGTETLMEKTNSKYTTRAFAVRPAR